MKEQEYFYFLALFTIGLAIIGAYFILPKWAIAAIACVLVIAAALCVTASIESGNEARKREKS